MKKALLLTISIGGCSFPAFSQNSVGTSDIIQIRPNTTRGNYLLADIGKPFLFGDSINLKSLPNLFSVGKVATDQNPSEIKLPTIVTHMPILRPDRNFSLQILEPDSTNFDALLIKEYQQR